MKTKEPPLEELQVRAAWRRQVAAKVWNSTFRQEFLLHTNIIHQCFDHAGNDLDSFEQQMGEPLPSHLREAIVSEMSIWLRLQEITQHTNITEKEYRALCKRLAAYTRVLVEVITLEEAILRSPLSQYFHERLQTLRERASTVSP